MQQGPFSRVVISPKSPRPQESGVHSRVFRRLKSCAVSGILTSEYVAEEEKKAVYLPEAAKKKTTSKTYTQNGEA